jgi:hypothetical protein
MNAKSKTHVRNGDSSKPPRPNPWTLDQELRELASAIRVPFIVDRIWNTLFTEEERLVIAANDTIGPDIIDIWSNVRGVSVQGAVVELAREVNLHSEADARRFLRALGKAATPADVKPSWDNSTGVLRLGECTIKRVRRRKAATNISRILDAFQEECWPPQILDPLPEIKELK